MRNIIILQLRGNNKCANMSKDDKQEHLAALWLAGSIGFSMLAAVVVAFFIGKCFDLTFNTAPWGTAIGLFLGFIAGIRSIYKRIMNKE